MIKYKNLLRWMRETHCTLIKSHEILLPKFEHNNTTIKVFFDKISKTGFHHIHEVQLLNDGIAKILSEAEVDNLIQNEAKYRVRLHHQSIFSDDIISNNGLLCLNNCRITEKILIDKHLLHISLSAKDCNHEKELIFNLKQKLQQSTDPLHQLWSVNNFIPCVSKFFPMLDGIGTFDIQNFDIIDQTIVQIQKGRIWLNNPLNPIIDTVLIPSLDFFELPMLSSEWIMKDASLQDLNMIHTWMNAPILAKSFRQAYPFNVWEQELKHLIDCPFTRPVILYHKNVASAYLEFYRPKAVLMGNSFPFDPTEMGFHLGIVDTDLINKKIGRNLMQEITYKILFNYPKQMIGAMVGEPDINNLSMVNSLIALSKDNFVHLISSIVLPHKCSYVFRAFR